MSQGRLWLARSNGIPVWDQRRAASAIPYATLLPASRIDSRRMEFLVGRHRFVYSASAALEILSHVPARSTGDECRLLDIVGERAGNNHCFVASSAATFIGLLRVYRSADYQHASEQHSVTKLTDRELVKPYPAHSSIRGLVMACTLNQPAGTGGCTLNQPRGKGGCTINQPKGGGCTINQPHGQGGCTINQPKAGCTINQPRGRGGCTINQKAQAAAPLTSQEAKVDVR